MDNGTCSIDGCDRPRAGRGWCAGHWSRWAANGDPLAEKPIRIWRAIDHPDGTRTCSRCGDRKPLNDFHKVASATLGRRSDCKVCRSERVKAWYAANRERQAAKEAARKAERPEVYRERDKRRSHEPARVELHAARVALRRARLTATQVDAAVTRANLRKQYGDSCFYCRRPMTFRRRIKGDPFPPDLATIDHVVPISRGGSHTWDNTVLACWRCNCAKRDSETWQPTPHP